MTTLNPPPVLVEPVIGRAVRDALPVVLAYAPFGLALGATLSAPLAAFVSRKRTIPDMISFRR